MSMLTDRLNELAKQLKMLQDDLANAEQTRMNADPIDYPRYDRRIGLKKQEIDSKAKEYSQLKAKEYWQVVAGSAHCLTIPESEAEVAVREIVDVVTDIEASSPIEASSGSDPSARILQLLVEIRDQLKQPGSTAAAKLKTVISFMPPFITLSYEAEQDPEEFFPTYFPTFTRLVKGAAKK